MYTGSFGHINAVEYLVEVAAEIQTTAPNMRFLLISDGVKRATTETFAQERGILGRNLFIWDPIPKQKIVNVLAAATVTTSLFVPLKPMWNNSANKFFDALAGGKPIAINYGGGKPIYSTKPVQALCSPQTIQQKVSAQLAAFVRDETRLQAASEAARHLARTRFDRDELARQLEAILRSVIEK